MRTWHKSLIGVGLGVVLGPAVLSVTVTQTRAQPPSRVEVKEPIATRWTVSPAVGPRHETQEGALPEELELLRIQVEMEGNQLHFAESRLEQAKRWESRAKELASHGDVPMEQLMVAQDGALMRQSDVVAQKAALRVAELRLLEAQRGISCERPLSSRSEQRLADVERRLAAMEQTVRDLRQEVLQVRDNGMGIAPDLLPRVFDLFQQGEGPGDQACGGLGIGLALVKSLVELHGGNVSAFSAGPGTGSQFVVRLLDCAPNVQEGRALCRPENGASLAATGRYQ